MSGRRPSDPHHLCFAQHRALSRKVSDEFTVRRRSKWLGKGQLILRFQLRRVTLFHSRDVRLANLGWKLFGITPLPRQILVRTSCRDEVPPRRFWRACWRGAMASTFLCSRRAASASQRVKPYFVQLLGRKRTERAP